LSDLLIDAWEPPGTTDYLLQFYFQSREKANLTRVLGSNCPNVQVLSFNFGGTVSRLVVLSP
jgi:hypothetical protein